MQFIKIFSKWAPTRAPLCSLERTVKFEKLLEARFSRLSETFLAQADSVNSEIFRIVIEVQI